jgi:transcriptional regulator with GAF, ATPase, and Fis domain
MEIKTLSAKEKELLQKALERTGWNLQKAARLLEIPVDDVKKKISLHGLKRDPVS